MESYEAMKAQVLTAIALKARVDEIRAKEQVIIFGDIFGVETEILIISAGSEKGFNIYVGHEDDQLFLYATFVELEEERERLLNKPGWPEDDQWQARAIDQDGDWFFYTKDIAGHLEANEFEFDTDDGSQFRKWEYLAACCNSIAFPAGFDWKESLEFRPE